MPIAEVNGAQIHYEAQGDGPPLLLIPGLGTRGGYFGLGEPLLRGTRRTILVDPRGIGRSNKRDANFIAETWADDFAALLDHLPTASRAPASWRSRTAATSPSWSGPRR